uniref:Ground-like domain-containing protein n=1 Tax=Panagrellus redivivus TaxID=6233 RepID=A0A7E4VC26_PANRE
MRFFGVIAIIGLPIIAEAFLFPTGGGGGGGCCPPPAPAPSCGCGAPPPPPPPPPAPSCGCGAPAPAPSCGGGCGAAPPPPPAPSCGGGCGRKKRDVEAKTVPVTNKSKDLCNNEQFKKIITENIESENVSKNIHEALVKNDSENRFVVFCSKGGLNFFANTDNFCVHGNDNLTCYVYEA